MWDADKMMLEMGNALAELDPSGRRRAELQTAREGRRREQLGATVAGTGYGVADLVALSLLPAAAAAAPVDAQPATGGAAAATDGAASGGDVAAAEGAAATEPTPPPPMAQATSTEASVSCPPSVLSSVCLDRYLKATNVASALAAPLASFLHARQKAAVGGGEAEPPVVSEQSWRDIFGAIDTEGGGVVSVRQLLLGLHLATPPAAVRQLLEREGLMRAATEDGAAVAEESSKGLSI